MTPSPDDRSAALSRPVDVSALERGETVIVLEADENQRRAIAERLGVPGVDRLHGEFRLTPFPDGVDLNLRLEASVQRRCVVSLEPMTESVRETIVTRFEKSFHDEQELSADLNVEREPLEGDRLDLGEILVQHLSLSLDPYPRKPDAQSLLAQYRDATSDSPFEALKGLVDRDR